jgi:hypothetical protein
MYRERVDQATQNDIAAATAAHRELGRDYDDAVAEGLIERIGAEIDKRVDARLGARPRSSRPPVTAAQPSRYQALWMGTGLGAGITGLVAMIADDGSPSKAVIAAVITVWVILAVAGLGTAAVHRYRSTRRG